LKRLLLGAALLLLSTAVGAVLGYIASVSVLFVLISHLGHVTINQAWMLSLAVPPQARVCAAAVIIFGALGGTLLGVWLIRTVVVA
jgi:hypothetical protein